MGSHCRKRKTPPLKMYRFFLFFLFFIFSIYAKQFPITNPQYFDMAYIPWYTGSLFSISAHTTPKGIFCVQPYLFYQLNYGMYNQDFSIKNSPKQHIVEPWLVFYYGFTDKIDSQLNIQGFTTYSQSKSSTEFGDIQFLLGFQILTENATLPYIRLYLQESFPTGKYQKLNPNKKNTDISGSGSFETTIGLSVQKIHDWWYFYPCRFRYNLSFTAPSKVKVEGINTYGGTINTKATLFPGNYFSFLFSPEFSLTQKWVATFDLIYTHNFPNRFTHQKNRNENFNIHAQDLLEFAPAIEYNFSQSFGVLGGINASLLGKNVPAFFSVVFSIIGSF